MPAKVHPIPTLDHEKRLENIERMLEELLSSSRRSAEDSKPAEAQLRISFDRVSDGRKPFKIAIDGIIRSTLTVSSVRTAILLVGFLDLQDRLEGGAGCLDMVLQIQRALTAIDGNTRDAADLAENVRVGIYRTASWLNDEKTLVGESLELVLNPATARLEVNQPSVSRSEIKLHVEISTRDSTISRIVDEVLGVSPLTRLRRTKAGYFAPGHASHDRLVMEIFDHRYPVTMHSLFPRLVSHSYPPFLLRSLGVSPDRFRRAELVAEGLASGRIHSVEILNRESLTQMITKQADGTFPLYRPETAADDVKAHIDHIVSWLEHYPQFEIVLTDAYLPFFLGAYELKLPTVTERFVMFYQRLEGEYLFKTGSFVLAEDGVYHAVQSKVITWIYAHPTTRRSKPEVIKELLELKDRISQQ